MFTIRYQLVPDRYLGTKRGTEIVVLGNFTMQDGRMQTNSTVENYHQKPIPRGNASPDGWGSDQNIRIERSLNENM